MESEICRGSSGAGEVLNWDSDLEWLRGLDWGRRRVKLWMRMPSTLGGGRSRKGMGIHKDLWTKRGLGLSCGTPVHCSTFRVGPEAADLNWTIHSHSD